MVMPCGKQVPGVVTEQALAELNAMSAATVDRHLKPARDRTRIKGISTTNRRRCFRLRSPSAPAPTRRPIGPGD
jgi:hypothetical protein